VLALRYKINAASIRSPHASPYLLDAPFIHLRVARARASDIEGSCRRNQSLIAKPAGEVTNEYPKQEASPSRFQGPTSFLVISGSWFQKYGLSISSDKLIESDYVRRINEKVNYNTHSTINRQY